MPGEFACTIPGRVGKEHWMLRVRVYDAARQTDGYGYQTTNWEFVSGTETKIVNRATILAGPFEGQTATALIYGVFDLDASTTEDWTVREVRIATGGKTHFTERYDRPLRWDHFDDDFASTVASGVEFQGNRFANWFFGHTGDDRLYGGGGDDWLGGAAGKDVLDGGDGRDLLEGGRGSDVYHVDNAGDRVVELRNQGVDEVRSTVDFRLPADVENLDLQGEAVKGQGNSRDNVLKGNAADNRLYGGSGDDTLSGGKGDDRLSGGSGRDGFKGGPGDDLLILDIQDGDYSRGPDGGSGDDTASFSGVDHAINATPVGPDDNDWLVTAHDGELRLFSVEAIIGSNFDDRVTGRDIAERIRGQGGDDQIDGGFGDDILDGGSGKDVLAGGNGDDHILGGLGRDNLTGGKGADVFVFLDVSESRVGGGRDVVTDARAGRDMIDVSEIDACSARGGNQRFTFIGDQQFSGTTAQLRYADGVIAGDVNGDGVADFEIGVANDAPLTEDDLIL